MGDLGNPIVWAAKAAV